MSRARAGVSPSPPSFCSKSLDPSLLKLLSMPVLVRTPIVTWPDECRSGAPTVTTSCARRVNGHGLCHRLSTRLDRKRIVEHHRSLTVLSQGRQSLTDRFIRHVPARWTAYSRASSRHTSHSFIPHRASSNRITHFPGIPKCARRAPLMRLACFVSSRTNVNIFHLALLPCFLLPHRRPYYVRPCTFTSLQFYLYIGHSYRLLEVGLWTAEVWVRPNIFSGYIQLCDTMLLR